MKNEQERITDTHILGDEVAASRRDFLKSVGKYSMGVAGAMMLASAHLSNREAVAADTMQRSKSSSSSSRMRKSSERRAIGYREAASGSSSRMRKWPASPWKVPWKK